MKEGREEKERNVKGGCGRQEDMDTVAFQDV